MPRQRGHRARAGAAADVDVEPLDGDLVAAPRVAELARDRRDEVVRAAVVVDAEARSRRRRPG